MSEVIGLEEFLIWLSAGGSVIAFSWLAEFFGWFENKEPKQKKIIFFGFDALIALSAQAILTYVPTEILVEVAPWFATVAGIFGLIFLGEAFHAKNKAE